MTLRVVGAVILLLLAFSEAFATHHQRPTDHISCTDVRYFVARYSAALAEMYARNHGATDAQIERARRCLASNESVENGGRRSDTD
jgi:hypothetical protein